VLQPRRCVTPDLPDSVEVADQQTLPQLDENSPNAMSRVTEAFSQQEAEQQLCSLIFRQYDPYISWAPFMVVQDDASSVSVSRNRHDGAAIVYNLGLIHQWYSRSSPKVGAFYEIAYGLLSYVTEMSQESFTLRLCILNNLAAWCYENGAYESMRLSLGHLSEALDGMTHQHTNPIVHGMRTNIQWLLDSPVRSGGPAV